MLSIDYSTRLGDCGDSSWCQIEFIFSCPHFVYNISMKVQSVVAAIL